MLLLPKYLLIADVPTGWSFSNDLVGRHLEQKTADYSALVEEEISNLTDVEGSTTGRVGVVMKPLKTLKTL